MADSVFSRPLFSQDPSSVVRQDEFGTFFDKFGNILGQPSTVRQDEFGTFFDKFGNILGHLPTVRDDEFGEFNIQMKQKPEMDDYTKAVSSDEFQSFLLDAYGDRGQNILDILLQGNTPDNFSMLVPLLNEFTNYKISNEMKEKGAIPPKPFEIPEQELNYLNRLKNRAEGSPMEGEMSEAVGIADGLDQESMPADPNGGLAKVSPEQYVQLMNEVRGDDVPLEGRVEELAMTVGEKDARDTPLSVLALVQPVFELQEQQGIGATEQAQGMPPMASDQLMNPQNGGIVRAADSLFVDQPFDYNNIPGLSIGYNQPSSNAAGSMYGGMLTQPKYDFLTTMGEKMFDMGKPPVDVTQKAKEYETKLLENADLKPKFLTSVVTPLLAKTAMDLLDPEKSFSEVLVGGLTNIGIAGQAGEKMKEPYATQALNLAVKDKEVQQTNQSDFIKLFGAEAIKKAFADAKLPEIAYQTVGGIPIAFYKDGPNAGTPVNNQDIWYNTLANQRIEIINDKNKLQVADSIKNLFTDLTNEELIQLNQDPDYFVKNNKRFKDDFLNTQEGKEWMSGQEDILRKEYLANTKDFAASVRQFKILDTIAEDATGATDMALVYTYMKILDPASVVRESEYGVAAQTDLSKIDAATTDLINKVLNGATVLTDKQRASLIAAARGTITGAYKSYESFTNQFKGIAERRGLDTNNVIIDYTLGLDIPKVDEFSSRFDYTKYLDDLILAPLGSEFIENADLENIKNELNR